MIILATAKSFIQLIRRIIKRELKEEPVTKVLSQVLFLRINSLLLETGYV